jgi:3-oxoacyl-[acyl-carrier-protein] synthase II
MDRRVVITGMGTINPLGLNVSETWGNALKGVSTTGPITSFDASDSPIRFACEVRNFDPERYMDERNARRRDRFEQFAIAATQEALKQAKFFVMEENAGRVGVIVSTAVGGLKSLLEGIRSLMELGPSRISPFVVPKFMPNGASGMIALEIGAKGPAYSVASACASGSDSIGQAWSMIRSGIIDACIAGGSEATINTVGINAFGRLRALSRRNEEYTKVPAPFDKDRDGLVMAEGSAVVILEALDHARARGAEILAELVGHSATTDSFHITAPDESGAGGAAAIVGALQAAGLRPDEVDYINAHGTGTVLNDVAETRAIKSALGEHAYRIPVSSTKSMTGHMMGATGALETIFCVQAIRDGVVPPTINLVHPDPDCDLDYVPNEARRHDVRVAINNAFGLGGHNAVLALRAFQG